MTMECTIIAIIDIGFITTADTGQWTSLPLHHDECC